MTTVSLNKIHVQFLTLLSDKVPAAEPIPRTKRQSTVKRDLDEKGQCVVVIDYPDELGKASPSVQRSDPLLTSASSPASGSGQNEAEWLRILLDASQEEVRLQQRQFEEEKMLMKRHFEERQRLLIKGFFVGRSGLGGGEGT